MPVSPHEVVIDLGRDARLSQHALETLADRYLVAGETSPQHAFARACAAFADDAAHAQRLYEYVTKGWFMFATPLLSNGGTDRGLPISCYLNYMPDSRKGILNHYEETSMLSSMGGGIGGYAAVRGPEETSKGSASSGYTPFVAVIDRLMLAFSQGKTRRGSYCTYLDITHPEMDEFLELRKPTGDANRKAVNLHHAVVITDDFMHAMLNDREWHLTSPKTGRVMKTLSARALFRKIVETRHQTGEPFILFGDTANRALPQPLKDKGLKINHSNLCTEIMLPTSADRTAVCCLSSTNLDKWEEWKDDPLFIEDLMRMLDNTLTDFIDRADPETMWRAINSAKAERSVGLGAMGLHSFLQRKMIPWGSDLARGYNVMMFEHLKKMTDAASLKLGAERGEAPDMEGTGHRFAHRMAVAPNASSSIFLLCSPSIEQWPENIFIHKTLTGSHKVKNPALEALLEGKGKNTDAVWRDILANDGSVQHLTFLSDAEKMVFLTAFETDQRLTVQMNNDRTPFVDQGISLNISVPAIVDAEYLMEIHAMAWAGGSKSMYYMRTKTLQKAENMNTKVAAMELVVPEEEGCLACEG